MPEIVGGRARDKLARACHFLVRSQLADRGSRPSSGSQRVRVSATRCHCHHLGPLSVTRRDRRHYHRLDGMNFSKKRRQPTVSDRRIGIRRNCFRPNVEGRAAPVDNLVCLAFANDHIHGVQQFHERPIASRPQFKGPRPQPLERAESASFECNHVSVGCLSVTRCVPCRQRMCPRPTDSFRRLNFITARCHSTANQDATLAWSIWRECRFSPCARLAVELIARPPGPSG
jgi:hypothetical protein